MVSKSQKKVGNEFEAASETPQPCSEICGFKKGVYNIFSITFALLEIHWLFLRVLR